MGNMNIGWHGKLIIVKQKLKVGQIIFVIYSLRAFPVIEIKVIHLVLSIKENLSLKLRVQKLLNFLV